MMKINIAATALLLMLFSLSADDKPLRIMPLGDSITAGYTDNSRWAHPFEFGYRSGLYKRLTAAKINFKFVGKSPEPMNKKFGDPTHGGKVQPVIDLRKVGQDGHRGYGGWNIGGLRKNIAKWIDEDKPDIILLLAGINGINPKSPEQLHGLVKEIYRKDQNLKLIVAQITPLSKFNKNLYAYNQYIRQKLVPEFSKLGRAIITVDLYTHFLKNPKDPASIDINRLSNKINHPGNKYYDKMAESWFEGIKLLISNKK